MLLAKLKEPSIKFVISYDESLNKILQQEQMYMIIRFWDKTTHRVISRYFDQFRKIIVRYKRIGYNINIMRQSACLGFNPITVNNVPL